MMNDLLFAYGFLKRAYHGSEATKTPEMDVEFVCEGIYTGKIYLVDRYPGVVYGQHSGLEVYGEVFRMKSPLQLLPQLDAYENALPWATANPQYQRILRPIKTPQGTMTCWVYEYLPPVIESTRILSGRF